MSYDHIRHFADSWGLIAMGALFLSFVGWTFRKGAKRAHHDAATSIFRDDDNGQETR
jgi:cytochrome c oxidase cbb3-type subunit IV